MRALSFWEPWLQGGILRFGKRIENRDAWTGCSYRGPILLHSALNVGTQDDFDAAMDDCLDIANPSPGVDRIAAVKGLAECRIGGRGRHHAEGWWTPHPDLVRGAIVGRARVDGVIRNASDLASYLSNVPGVGDQERWWAGGFALVLADVEAIAEPIPFKGKQGFFDVPETALAGATWKAC